MNKTWRLATFNIESLDERAGAPEAFSARVEALRPRLLELDADVLCLQEVDAQGHGGRRARRFTALEHLLAGTPYAAFHMRHSVNPLSAMPADVHNLVTLSRWPVAHHRQYFHDIVPVARVPLTGGAQAEVRFDRPATLTSIDAPCGPLHVFNVHLRAPRAAPVGGKGKGGHWESTAAWAEGFHLAALKRQAQALEVRLAADALFDAGAQARIAVCGDFNAGSFETPWRILRGARDEGPEPEFAARELVPLELKLAADARYSVIHDGRRVLLDHILASPKLAAACRDVQIFNAGLADEAHTEGPVDGSLHAAMAAQFDGG